MATKVDLRLVGPLNQIAELAVGNVKGCSDPNLDLFLLRSVIRSSTIQIAAYLRERVEQLTNRSRSVRRVQRGALLSDTIPTGINNVLLVVCDPRTPEGFVGVCSPGMFPFAVTGSLTGYMTMKAKP